MTDLRAAAQQALEALETCDAAHPSDGGRQWYDEKLVEPAIDALRAALAEPVQEPVATMTVRDDMGADFKFNRAHTLQPGQEFHLCTSPLQRPAETAGEPVAWMYTGIKSDGSEHGPHLVWRPEYMDAMSAEKGAKAVPLYGDPPQRKPLTEDQLDDIAVAASKGNLHDLRIAIEQAHGIGSKT